MTVRARSMHSRQRKGRAIEPEQPLRTLPGNSGKEIRDGLNGSEHGPPEAHNWQRNLSVAFKGVKAARAVLQVHRVPALNSYTVTL